eukprot:sb/3472166/
MMYKHAHAHTFLACLLRRKSGMADRRRIRGVTGVLAPSSPSGCPRAGGAEILIVILCDINRGTRKTENWESMGGFWVSGREREKERVRERERERERERWRWNHGFIRNRRTGILFLSLDSSTHVCRTTCTRPFSTTPLSRLSPFPPSLSSLFFSPFPFPLSLHLFLQSPQ